jgi:AraC-like DNA-binding protein
MEPVIYIGLAQSLFAGFVIATRKPQHLADRILSAWLFLIAIEFSFALINNNFITLTAFTFIPFTYGPLLILYIRFLIVEKPVFKPIYLLHFIPFLVFFVLSAVYRNAPIINLRNFFHPDTFLTIRMIYSISFFLSVTIYSIIAFIIINKHQQNIKDLFSYKSGKITLTWLKIVSICFYSTYFLMFVAGGINILISNNKINPLIFAYAGFTFFAFAISFYGYRQQAVFMELNKQGDKSGKDENIASETRYEKSGLKENMAEKYKKLLLDYMLNKKPYLDGGLTIHDVSESLNIPRHHLTQVINENMKMNFYYFINEYRVEEAKNRLTDPKFKKFTILSIAYDSGFNSKSSFNGIFKKFTGYTPSDYINK